MVRYICDFRMRLNPVTIVAMTTTETSAPPVACTKNTNISDLVAHLPYIKKIGKLFKKCTLAF